MQVDNYSNLNFKAIKVATAKSIVSNNKTTIDIYRLTNKDKRFLETLLKNFELTKRLPKNNEYEQKVWGDIFKYSVYNALLKGNTSYVAVSENKPCGIICYAKNKITDLIGICALPDKEGNKTPFVGTTFFYHLFNDVLQSGAKNIKLEAVNDSPIDVVKKYLSLGFKITSAEGRYTQMSINRYKIKEQLEILKNRIKYEVCEPKEANLEQFLN